MLPDREELRKLLDGYFRGPYHFCFYSFLHAPTIMQMFDNGHVPESLLLIIAATTLRILDPDDPRPHRWADECRRKVLLDAFLPPTQTTLQTFILLQRYEWHRGSHMSAWITSAIAVRLTHALQLNLELPRKSGNVHPVSLTVREMRRRTLWACFVMESLMESGRHPFSGLDLSSIETNLPGDEHSFQLGIGNELPGSWTDSASEPSTILNLPSFQGRPDIPAYLVRLAILRLLILQYTAPYHPRNADRMPETLPWLAEGPFYQFEAELTRWSADFPDSLRLSTDNLYRRQPDLLGFVTFHCMFHGCYCDLYRIGSYLTTDICQRANSPFAGVPDAFLRRCKTGRLQNAMAIASTIETSLPHLRSEHDPFTAISACLAIRILAVERGSGNASCLSLDDQRIRQLLQTSVKCAKQTARWSAPIRKLLHALGQHAQQCGFDLDISDLKLAGRSSIPHTRPASPSLRTYGTFGSIQSSLTKGNDSLTPAVSAGEPEQSDIFVAASTPSAPQLFTTAAVDNSASAARPILEVPTYDREMSLNFPGNHGWAEWDPNPMGIWDTSFPLGWADHSLGFDPEHDWSSGFL